MSFSFDCNINTLLLIFVIGLIFITLFNVRCTMNMKENFDSLDFNSMKDGARLKWSEYNAKCNEKGMRLCNSNEVCPIQGGEPSFDDRFNDQDNWIAVGDSNAEGLKGDWTTLGNSGMPERKCKTHVQNGFGYPGWSENNEGTWVRGAKCCN